MYVSEIIRNVPGNIAIDSDMLRVSVLKTPESEVETYNAIPKSK